MSSPIDSSQWMYNAGGSFYDFEISNSLRFQPAGTTDASIAADNPYLNATLSGSGGTIWTFSCWVKLADLGTNRYLLQGITNTSNYTYVYISNADQVYVYSTTGAYVRLRMHTTALLRDTNSWYHIVVKFNGTSGSTELKIYINGVNQALTTVNSFTAHQSLIANSNAHYIGNSYNYVRDMAGYMAEVNLIDGTALDADSFGETVNGIWVPKDTSDLTFGDNGFRLQFKQTGTDGDANGIGADTSGSTNHFAVGDTDGLGATDVMLDSPTNNFAVGNSLSSYSNNTFSEGNLKVTGNGVNYYNYLSSMSMETGGKYYFEVYSNKRNSSYWAVGICKPESFSHTMSVYNTAGSMALQQGKQVYYLNSEVDSATNRYNSTAYVFSFAIDLDNNLFHFRADGGTWENSGDPAAGSGGYAIASAMQGVTLIPWFGPNGANYQVLNFGQDSSFANNKTSGSANAADGNGIGDFYYAPPSGFLALASSSLPEPAIINGSEHFNTVLYTGNATGSRAITGVGFSPDFVWAKVRSNTYPHFLANSVVGSTKYLNSNSTDAEATDSTYFTSFDSGGFTIGSSGGINGNNETFVAWNWLAGTTASGSEVGNNPAFSSSSNSDAGFSIVSYTGTGSAGTVSHGCGAKPTMIMIKNRDQADNWAVYHAGTASDPETDYMILNTVAAVADSANWWNDTAPTDSVFTVGTDHTVNADGEDYIAYCFADVDGYLKASHYIGNNTFNFVHTGFRPAFLMLKKTSASTTYGWQIYDTSRSPINVAALPGMWADTNAAEAATTYSINIHSNGFRLTGAGTNQNASGVRYVYFAIADQPAKFSNAR